MQREYTAMYEIASTVFTEKPACCSLVPLQELICDTCGQVIASPGEGLLQWKVRVNPYRMYDLSIIHDPQVSLHHGGCGISGAHDTSVSHAHLTFFTGEDGLSKIFQLLRYDYADRKSLTEVLYRLHVPFYEEARQFIEKVKGCGYMGSEDMDTTPKMLLETIERFREAHHV